MDEMKQKIQKSINSPSLQWKQIKLLIWYLCKLPQFFFSRNKNIYAMNNDSLWIILSILTQIEKNKIRRKKKTFCSSQQWGMLFLSPGFIFWINKYNIYMALIRIYYYLLISYSEYNNVALSACNIFAQNWIHE